ncbi:MAG: hypothetical protein PHQ75_14640 [Thermoguttaceae bacterium]|nr:hypothetical protein [Thermoguttaceae bacterium]
MITKYDHEVRSRSTITKYDHEVRSRSTITKYDHEVVRPGKSPVTRRGVSGFPLFLNLF